MKFVTATVAVTIALAAYPHAAEGHGFISEPKATYTGGSSYTSFSKEFTADSKFGGRPFNRSPQQNVDEFTAAWPKTGYSSMRDLFKAKQVSECGFTNPNAAAVDVSRMSTMKYQNNEYKEGFLASHHGPCEGWIDNTKVFHYDDCVKNFPSFPAVIPVSYSSCKGTCRLSFYWLALHSQKWQAYVGCVPIKNGSGGKARSMDDDEPTSVANTTKAQSSVHNLGGQNSFGY